MAQIFISYKRADKDKVFPLVAKIEKELGCECWVDLDGIESSVQFASVICRAIDNAEVVLFMHSSIHATIDFESDWTIKELNYAQNKKKRVVLVKLDDTPLDNIFLLEYGSKNNIDSNDPVQFNKLLNDLKSWIHLPSDISSKPSQGQSLTQHHEDQSEPWCPCGSGKLFKDCHGKTDAVPGTPRTVSPVAVQTNAIPRKAVYDMSIENQMSKILELLNAYKLNVASITANVQSDGVMYKITPGIGASPSAIANLYREIALNLGVNKVTATAYPDGVALVVHKEKTWKVGDYYNVDGKEGVVFWVDASGEHGKIVSLDQTKVEWSTRHRTKKGLTDIAVDKRDGMKNLQSIMNIKGWRNEFPAFAWCADLGDGWYLPAIEELELLLLNDDIHDVVNARIETLSRVKFPLKRESGWYWSSTEYRGYSAWGVNLFVGCTYDDYRDCNLFVRAVSAF